MLNYNRKNCKFSRKRIISSFAIIIIIILIIMCVFELYCSAYKLECVHYEIKSGKITSNVRIVQLSDLHNSTFAENNVELVESVKNQSPDIILITGDLLNSGEEDTSIAIDLISELSEICPVYISNGNHEAEFEEQYDIELNTLYEEAGGIVLEREYEDIDINGQQIRIAGIYGNCLPPSYLETGEADEGECDFLYAVQNTENYTILMCHNPVCWLVTDALNEWNIDCVFSGHVHGGEVIIPFLGGLYAPDLGWFPGRLQGLYYSEDGSKTLILSRGLGTTEIIPRFNNRPEVVVVDVVPE